VGVPARVVRYRNQSEIPSTKSEPDPTLETPLVKS
jgi:hypothetical protein